MIKGDKTQVMNHGPMGFVMFAAYVGALVYFIQQSHSFGDVLFSFLQAMVWPGFVVYHVLKGFGA